MSKMKEEGWAWHSIALDSLACQCNRGYLSITICSGGKLRKA